MKKMLRKNKNMSIVDSLNECSTHEEAMAKFLNEAFEDEMDSDNTEGLDEFDDEDEDKDENIDLDIDETDEDDNGDIDEESVNLTISKDMAKALFDLLKPMVEEDEDMSDEDMSDEDMSDEGEDEDQLEDEDYTEEDEEEMQQESPKSTKTSRNGSPTMTVGAPKYEADRKTVDSIYNNPQRGYADPCARSGAPEMKPHVKSDEFRKRRTVSSKLDSTGKDYFSY